MSGQDLDRNEPATPYKLEKAKDKGQVSKSTDVVSAVVFTVCTVYVTWHGWDTVVSQFRLDKLILAQLDRSDINALGLWALVAHMIGAAMVWLAPFFTCVMAAAILATVLQTGPVLSLEPVKADFDRLNPVNGFKKVFSTRSLFDLVRACAKLALLLGAAYQALLALAPQFYNLAGLPPSGYLRTLLDDISALGLKMALVLCLIALVDLLFTRHEFAKKCA